MVFDLKNLLNEVSIAPMQDGESISAPFEFIKVKVKPEWIDYNGHMNEAMYITVVGHGYEAFVQYIGMDSDWVATKGSYFTAESHCVYIQECSEGDELTVQTYIVDADEKRLHMFSKVFNEDKELLFTCEQMLLYVNPISRRVEPAQKELYKKVTAIVNSHSKLERPEQIGRTIGIKRK